MHATRPKPNNSKPSRRLDSLVIPCSSGLHFGCNNWYCTYSKMEKAEIPKKKQSEILIFSGNENLAHAFGYAL